jgi:hypothetical protein
VLVFWLGSFKATFGMINELGQSEASIRLGCFLGIFALMSLWE